MDCLSSSCDWGYKVATECICFKSGKLNIADKNGQFLSDNTQRMISTRKKHDQQNKE